MRMGEGRRRKAWVGMTGTAGAVALLASAALAGCSKGPGPPRSAADVRGGRTYPLVFPVKGESTLQDSFGEPRDGVRRHEGVDIMAPKGTPVVAVADGTVIWTHGRGDPGCCSVAVRHDDGWSSHYLHLNNDRRGTDDGRGRGIAKKIEPKSRVRSGQRLGWVGDSGNAEGSSPHLHFELRDPANQPVDPYASLRAAARR